MRLFLIAALTAASFCWAWGYTPGPRDETDPPDGRSALMIRTDAKTGCQYLSSGLGGVTPRMDGAGHHLGCRL